MIICIEGTVAHLYGNLAFSGMTHGSIDSLVHSLQQIEFGGEKNIRIDCGSIRTVDINGLQLLYVWMQCVRFMGVEPELVNLTDSLRQTLKRMGLGHCFPVRERTFCGLNTTNGLAGT